jgi:hypothetical protein
MVIYAVEVVRVPKRGRPTSSLFYIDVDLHPIITRVATTLASRLIARETTRTGLCGNKSRCSVLVAQNHSGSCISSKTRRTQEAIIMSKARKGAALLISV